MILIHQKNVFEENLDPKYFYENLETHAKCAKNNHFSHRHTTYVAMYGSAPVGGPITWLNFFSI